MNGIFKVRALCALKAHLPFWEINMGFLQWWNKIPHVQSTHCFLHRYAFASKALPTKLKELLDVSAKTIKWIRGRVLTHRFFKSLCEDLGSKRTVSLFQIEVRWLSRWRVLTRFFELRKEPVFPEKRHYDLLCRVTIANLSWFESQIHSCEWSVFITSRQNYARFELLWKSQCVQR